jgi:photosystem II stability/assembly factor-like uncharacterized protein
MLHVSAGGGSTWTDYAAVLQDGCTLAWGTALYQAGSYYNSTLAARQMAVARSTNRGASWSTTTLCPDSFGYVSSLTFRTDNPSIGYASGYYYSYTDNYYHGKLFKTTNGGTSWSEFGASTFDEGKIEVRALVSDPVNPNTLIVGTPSSVYTSTDGGGTFAVASPTANYPECIVADPNVAGRFWLGSTYSGVWVSTNSGRGWQQMNTGLNTLNVLCLTYDAVNHVLYAGLKGAGAYRYEITNGVDTENGESVPTTMELEQNYPNPFNGETRIGYRVSGPGSRDVKLAVYDVLGREVAVLVDGEKDSGHYSVTFNASGLASGVYYYRLTSNGSVATRTMILAK